MSVSVADRIVRHPFGLVGRSLRTVPVLLQNGVKRNNAVPASTRVMFADQDNSGKGNIFPNINKPFVSSPVTDAIASQGLGGAQGGAIVVRGGGCCVLRACLLV